MRMSYTMADIERFLIDYRQSQRLRLKSGVAGVPVVGKEIYERFCLEESKREYFEHAYNKALAGSIEQQMSFIMKMTPILNDYYGKEESKGMKR